MVAAASVARAVAPPVFTPRQRNGIRKIARRFRYPYDQWWDFVHEAWLKVHDGWLRVPRVEPSMTSYIFKIAHNLAIDLLERFEDDAMTGAVVFSALPEWELEEEDEQDGEDRAGTPAIERLTMEKRVLAHQLWERAAKLDPEAAGWLGRTAIGEETVPEIAADVRKPASRIYKRLSRLVMRLRVLSGDLEAATKPARRRRCSAKASRKKRASRRPRTRCRRSAGTRRRPSRSRSPELAPGPRSPRASRSSAARRWERRRAPA
jgi:DNA-directed RNA polymerase specialized sigma24 family protein